MKLLLGIDEGTSAVKAVLYDADLRPVKEARREKALTQPKPGWVEQDAEEVLATVVDAVAELLRDAPGEIAACGLDHQGESVLAWDAESGRPLTPIVTWQDKRSQEVLDRIEARGRADEVRERSGMPLDPYFSAGKLSWLLEHDEAVGGARDDGTLRLGTVDSFLCDRLGSGFSTDQETASRTQLGDPEFDPVLL
jgi:glycerol kinase